MIYTFIRSITIALGLGAASLTYASSYSLTSSGVIDYGYDLAGIFGPSVGDISGLNYSLTISADPSLNLIHGVGNGTEYAIGGSAFGTGVSPVNVSATVNGQTYSAVLSNAYGNTQAVASKADYYQVYADARNYDAAGNYTQVLENVNSATNHFVPVVSLYQTFDYAPQLGDQVDVSFWLLNADASTTYFRGRASLISLRASSAVSESASVALLMLGLFGLFVKRRYCGVTKV